MNSKDTRLNQEKKPPLSTTQKFADERLLELGSEALFRCQDIDTTRIALSVFNGVMHLAGSVQERAAIRIAEHCLKKIDGIKGIENDLIVRKSAPESLH